MVGTDGRMNQGGTERRNLEGRTEEERVGGSGKGPKHGSYRRFFLIAITEFKTSTWLSPVHASVPPIFRGVVLLDTWQSMN